MLLLGDHQLLVMLIVLVAVASELKQKQGSPDALEHRADRRDAGAGVDVLATLIYALHYAHMFYTQRNADGEQQGRRTAAVSSSPRRKSPITGTSSISASRWE